MTPAELLREQARLNRVNQNTPYGSQTWTEGPDGRSTLTTTLPQQENDILWTQRNNALRSGQAQSRATDTVLGAAGGQVNTRDLPGLSGAQQGGRIQQRVGLQGLPQLTGANDFSADRQRVERGILDRQRPEAERSLRAIESRLSAQGIPVGSQAYRAEMERYQAGQNDARLAAIQAGGQEQSRLFGLNSQARAQLGNERFQQGAFANQAQNQGFTQGLQGTQLTNNARQQGLQEQIALRNQPINELNALRSGQQQQQPQFGQQQGLDVTGAYGLQAQQRAQQQAQNSAFNGGLFGLGGSLLGAGIQSGAFNGLGNYVGGLFDSTPQFSAEALGGYFG